MKKRIFLAINLPDNILGQLKKYQNNWPDLPCRWIKPENLHITILFLGFVSDDALLDILKVCKKVANNTVPFNIYFDKIIYGPSDQKIPRMVWLEGNAPKELINLKNKLENELMKTKTFQYWRPEKRPFKLHITLGRIKGMEFRQMEYPPEINELVNFNVPVYSFEIMESNLKRSGAEYTKLKSYNFGK